MQIAKTGRPWRRWRRRQSRRYYHAPTATTAMTTTTSATSTCLLELGPQVNDTACNNQRPGFNEITPQDCAEKCQEVYGDTMGSIGFNPTNGIPCSCCIGDDTLSVVDYTYYTWSKPCGGPLIPCGDKGVVLSPTEENLTCTDNTGFQVFTNLTDCAEECTITLEKIIIFVVSNSTHCACCGPGPPEASDQGFVINPAACRFGIS